VEVFYVVGVVLGLSRGAPVSMFCFARPDRDTLVKRDNTTDHGSSQRGRAATELSDTGRTSTHNASLAPLLTLRNCQAELSLPTLVFSDPNFEFFFLI